MEQKETNAHDTAFAVDGIHAADAQKYGTSGLTKKEFMAIEFTKAIIIGIVSASGKDAHGWSNDDFSKEGLLQADSLINQLNIKP